jgi:cation transport ATPase
MQARGLKVLVMSGDTPATVAAIAQQAGVTEFYAGVTPADKAAKVKELQSKGHIVAMVGDGINDTPALTVADVGIAIGAGTDVAIESAGIVLVRSELSDAVSALKLSRAVIRTIRQNLFWAFFYNILMIPLAAGLYYPLLGWQLSPAVAAASMSLSSLFVVGNALRLRRKQFITPVVPSMNTIAISVLGMMCPHCERHVSQALSAIPGVEEVKADHKSNTVTLTCSAPVNEAVIAAAVQQAGYDFKGLI